MAKKVKIAGYSKKITYDYGNVQYRDFNPDLVGLQFATRGGTSLFTMGNFNITTNLDPKLDRNYITGKYSNFITLDDLDLTESEAQSLLTKNTDTVLNLDNRILKNFALFGSMTEYVRITLENIITTWPASLHATQFIFYNNQNLVGDTYEDYSYDSINDVSTLKINVTFLENKFKINFLANGTIADTFNESNDLRNITVNYLSYVLFNNNTEYQLIEFTGSTSEFNDYIYLKVKGQPFTGTSASGKVNYHIRPNKSIINTFFNSLNGLSKYLLNRNVIPLYTTSFTYPVRDGSGEISYVDETITWPVSDGYNIDFDAYAYESYATQLLNICTNYDSNETNLMTRFLVSESISSFDTVPVFLDERHQDTTTGQKVNKTLNIYGRSFDDINQFIEGVSLAHSVSYDKQDNVPDKYLKDLARILGWDLVNIIKSGNLLNNYTENSDSTFSGVSVGLTPVEKDLELWRRIILNTPWLWKSKGARKSIEFLLNFMSIPKGLITFNEYVYRAKAPIDMEIFRRILETNGLDDDMSLYPVDFDGYPKPLADSENLYFQGNGLWFRETGGSGATIDLLYGNNPHVGPYDGGSAYINQFRRIIPNFSATTVEIGNFYSQGDITSYNGDVYVDVLNLDNQDISQCVVYKAEIIADPMPTIPKTDCGCPTEGDDEILSICLGENKVPKPICNNLVKTINPTTYYSPYIGEQIPYDKPFFVGEFNIFDSKDVKVGTKSSVYFSKECCKTIGGQPALYDGLYDTGINIDGNSTDMGTSGYVCCKTNNLSSLTCGCNVACDWSLIDRSDRSENSEVSLVEPIEIPAGSNNYFLKFRRQHGYGNFVVTTVDGSNCPTSKGYTTKVANITDPFSGEIGFGCRITSAGLADYQSNGFGSYFVKLFEARRIGSFRPNDRGSIGCCEEIETYTK